MPQVVSACFFPLASHKCVSIFSLCFSAELGQEPGPLRDAGQGKKISVDKKKCKTTSCRSFPVKVLLFKKLQSPRLLSFTFTCRFAILFMQRLNASPAACEAAQKAQISLRSWWRPKPEPPLNVGNKTATDGRSCCQEGSRHAASRWKPPACLCSVATVTHVMGS